MEMKGGRVGPPPSPGSGQQPLGMNRMAQSWPPTEKPPDEMWSPLAMPLCRLYPEISNECEPCSVTGVQIDRLLVLVGVDMWS